MWLERQCGEPYKKSYEINVWEPCEEREESVGIRSQEKGESVQIPDSLKWKNLDSNAHGIAMGQCVQGATQQKVSFAD